MKAPALPLVLAASIAFPGAQMAASTLGAHVAGPKNAARATTPIFKTGPPAVAGSPAPSHLFPVNDERGLLLTCVAPEMDTNQETDLFNNCTLAPGRTLDDVMHTFVRALHYEEHQRLKDRTDTQKSSGEKPAQPGEQ